MSIGDTGMLSDGFSDIESDLLSFVNSFDGSGAQPDERELVATYETLGNLDRNELAEIRYVRGISTVSARNVQGEQSATGNIRADVACGINQVPSFDVEDDVEVVTEQGNPTEITESAASDNEAANTFAFFNQVAAPQYFGAGGEGGGADTGETVVWEVNYAALGGGPVLDRFDDIVIESALKGDTVDTGISNEHRVQIWYKVDEFEDRGIQSFGRP